MKVDEQDWQDATKRLRTRREVEGHDDDNRNLPNEVRDFKTHITKCGYGSSVLDVGCGSQFLKTCLPSEVKYIGIDAFPIKGLDCIEGCIEDLKGLQVDTVCAMAVLDNCRDFDKACQVMKETAQKNIVILTGIDIPIDQYHTYNLQHGDFVRNFKDWDQTHYEELRPKVWLICYTRK